MELEGAGRTEFTELVADHRLGHVDRDVLATVVDGKRVANHVGDDCRAAAPGLNDLALAGFVLGIDLLEQVLVDEGTLFETACHVSVSLSVLLAGQPR
jgi:hypothetical protein